MISFALLCLDLFSHFHSFPGVRVGGVDICCKIDIKDHLSPAEAEIGSELGNTVNIQAAAD